ncbi:MAG: hypothetical protein GTO40_16635 [Deltaproteobacteria bacterium]|nr:hypothetical protein [Deltaproteobacteria bacterium]
MKNLRTFFNDWEEQFPNEVCRIKRNVSVKHEMTALAVQLEKQQLFPILVFENPVSPSGQKLNYPVVTNLLASRKRCAAALDIPLEEVAQGYFNLMSKKIPPDMVSGEGAPVKEVILRGDQLDLNTLPVLSHHEGTSGQRFTAAMVTTVDPETGIDNCSLQSASIRGKDKLVWSNGPVSHNSLNMKAWWDKGQDCPVAFWIGHHPAASLGGQQRLSHPESHYPGIGGIIGEPLKLVPTETFGKDLMVPADAEIVIEGYAPREVFESGHYAGDHAKTMIPIGPVPSVKVTCITHRRNAFYHDIAVSHADNLVMGGFALEAAVYDACKKVCPSVKNVHFPLSGFCRRIAYVQVSGATAGFPKAIISAALPVDNRLKYVFVVDEDVDIFDDREVLLALVNRAQLDRDMVLLSGMPDTIIDPVSVRVGDGYVTSKAGFDLTLPPSPGAGLPRQFEETVKIPAELEKNMRVEDYLGRDALSKLEREPQ